MVLVAVILLIVIILCEQLYQFVELIIKEAIDNHRKAFGSMIIVLLVSLTLTNIISYHLRAEIHLSRRYYYDIKDVSSFVEIAANTDIKISKFYYREDHCYSHP